MADKVVGPERPRERYEAVSFGDSGENAVSSSGRPDRPDPCVNDVPQDDI